MRQRSLHRLVQSPVDGEGAIAGGNREAACRSGSEEATRAVQRWARCRQASETGETGSVGDRHHASGIADIGRKAEGTMLIEAVYAGNTKVVVDNVVAAANRKFIFLSQNLREPTLASIGSPRHCHPRRKIFVVPVP